MRVLLADPRGGVTEGGRERRGKRRGGKRGAAGATGEGLLREVRPM